jgi:hypothetical protein
MLRRRDFVMLVGGGVVVGAAGGCADRSDIIQAAWRSPGAAETDPRRRWASYAILAPNPHNMQPWLLDLRRPGELVLRVDRTRLLPQTDPFNRQIVIGCGAFLDLLRMGAARDGVAARVEGFPEGEPDPKLDDRPVARVVFDGTAEPEALFRHVLERRTVRTAFEERPVPSDAMERLRVAAVAPGVDAHATIEPARVERLKAIALRGANIEAHTPAAHRESVERTFIGSKAVAEHRYGISLAGPQFDLLHAAGLLTREKMATPGSFAFKEAEKFMKTAADTSRGFVWTVTKGNTRAEQLAAGASYLRAGLQAAADGLVLQPWSQTLQEYGSMGPALKAAHEALAPEGGRVQMFARVGYAKPVPPSPRRGLSAHIA